MSPARGWRNRERAGLNWTCQQQTTNLGDHLCLVSTPATRCSVLSSPRPRLCWSPPLGKSAGRRGRDQGALHGWRVTPRPVPRPTGTVSSHASAAVIGQLCLFSRGRASSERGNGRPPCLQWDHAIEEADAQPRASSRRGGYRGAQWWRMLTSGGGRRKVPGAPTPVSCVGQPWMLAAGEQMESSATDRVINSGRGAEERKRRAPAVRNPESPSTTMASQMGVGQSPHVHKRVVRIGVGPSIAQWWLFLRFEWLWRWAWSGSSCASRRTSARSNVAAPG